VYGVSAISSLLISAFWAWVAYSALGFSLALARQVFIVFGALSVLSSPLLYVANERQVRDHSSKALVMTGTAFSALFSAAVLYFIAKHERETVLPIVYGVITIGLGVYISLFATRYEFE
jgi:ABC-type Fe3+-siderophore transport system permease subunit